MGELPPPKIHELQPGEQWFHAVAVWNDNPYVTRLDFEVAAGDEQQGEERVREQLRAMLAIPERVPPDRVELFTLEEWVTAGPSVADIDGQG
jgi:hypothetical protein